MRILGLDPVADSVAVKRRIGVVPEDLALFDRLTGEETLLFVGQIHGLDVPTARRRSADLLALMDLKEAWSTLVADFSHGMRKKLSLAAAVLPGPRLLFLDEPFEGIDAVASRQIKDLLQSFVSARGHDLPDVPHPGDRRTPVHPHRRDRQGQARRPGPDRRVAVGVNGAEIARTAVHRPGGPRRPGPGVTRLVLGMLRVLKAFAWLRWRMTMNAFDKTGGRDLLERFSLAIEQIGPIIAVLLLVPTAAILGGLGLFVGLSLGRGELPGPPLLAARYLLLAVPILALVGPFFLPGRRPHQSGPPPVVADPPLDALCRAVLLGVRRSLEPAGDSADPRPRDRVVASGAAVAGALRWWRRCC